MQYLRYLFPFGSALLNQPFVLSPPSEDHLTVLGLFFQVLVEPACGAALAAVYSYNNKAPGVLDNFPSVVVEVCGGSIFDLPSLNAWAAELGVAQ